MDPLSDSGGAPRSGPPIYRGEGVRVAAIVGQSRGQQPRAVLVPSIVGVCRQQDTQQAAPGVVLRVSQAGPDLPVNMLSLPSASSYQDHRYRRIGNEIVTDPAADGVCLQIWIDVSILDRLVDEARIQLLAERVLVALVLCVMKADETVSDSVSMQSICWLRSTIGRSARTATIARRTARAAFLRSRSFCEWKVAISRE